MQLLLGVQNNCRLEVLSAQNLLRVLISPSTGAVRVTHLVPNDMHTEHCPRAHVTDVRVMLSPCSSQLPWNIGSLLCTRHTG